MKARQSPRPTTVRLRSTDDENAVVVIRAGFAGDLASAIRFSLALARRWIDDGAKRKAVN